MKIHSTESKNVWRSMLVVSILVAGALFLSLLFIFLIDASIILKILFILLFNISLITGFFSLFEYIVHIEHNKERVNKLLELETEGELLTDIGKIRDYILIEEVVFQEGNIISIAYSPLHLGGRRELFGLDINDYTYKIQQGKIFKKEDFINSIHKPEMLPVLEEYEGWRFLNYFLNIVYEENHDIAEEDAASDVYDHSFKLKEHPAIMREKFERMTRAELLEVAIQFVEPKLLREHTKVDLINMLDSYIHEEWKREKEAATFEKVVDEIIGSKHDEKEVEENG